MKQHHSSSSSLVDGERGGTDCPEQITSKETGTEEKAEKQTETGREKEAERDKAEKANNEKQN